MISTFFWILERVLVNDCDPDSRRLLVFFYLSLKPEIEMLFKSANIFNEQACSGLVGFLMEHNPNWQIRNPIGYTGRCPTSIDKRPLVDVLVLFLCETPESIK